MSLLAQNFGRQIGKKISGQLIESAAQKVNRSRKHPERILMPKFVMWTGLVISFLGLTAIIGAFFSEPQYRIAGIAFGVVFALVGLLSLLTYVRFWYAIDPEGVSFQRAFRGEQRIRFTDIVWKEMVHQAKGPMVKMRDSQGTIFHIGGAFFSVLPISSRFAFFDQFQRWPSPEELREFVGDVPGVISTYPDQSPYQPYSPFSASSQGGYLQGQDDFLRYSPQGAQGQQAYPGGQLPASGAGSQAPWAPPYEANVPGDSPQQSAFQPTFGAAGYEQQWERGNERPSDGGYEQPLDGGYGQPSDADSGYSLDPAFRRPEPPREPAAPQASAVGAPDDDPTIFGMQAGNQPGGHPQGAPGNPQTVGYPQAGGYPQVAGYPQASDLPQQPSGYSQNSGHPQAGGYSAVPAIPAALAEGDGDETFFTGGTGAGVDPVHSSFGPGGSDAVANGPDPDATVLGIRGYESDAFAQQRPSHMPAAGAVPGQPMPQPMQSQQPVQQDAQQQEDPEATVFGMSSYGEIAQYPSGPGIPLPYGEKVDAQDEGRKGEGRFPGEGEGRFPGGMGIVGEGRR